jgi:hypothetical protein
VRNKEKQQGVMPLAIIVVTIVVLPIVIGIIGYIWFQNNTQGIPTGNVSYDFVSSRPEGKLYYPNGKTYHLFGFGQSTIKDGGTLPANAGAVMTSNDPPEKIYKWYIDWLIAHGWHNDAHMVSGLPIKVQISRISCSRGQRETFYVAMDDPKKLGMTLGVKFPSNITVFEFRYVIQ